MSDQKTVTCRYCKASMPDDAGAFYHEKDCHRRDVQRRMDEAEARPGGYRPGERASLEREMGRAMYTGD